MGVERPAVRFGVATGQPRLLSAARPPIAAERSLGGGVAVLRPPAATEEGIEGEQERWPSEHARLDAGRVVLYACASIVVNTTVVLLAPIVLLRGAPRRRQLAGRKAGGWVCRTVALVFGAAIPRYRHTILGISSSSSVALL